MAPLDEGLGGALEVRSQWCLQHSCSSAPGTDTSALELDAQCLAAGTRAHTAVQQVPASCQLLSVRAALVRAALLCLAGWTGRAAGGVAGSNWGPRG